MKQPKKWNVLNTKIQDSRFKIQDIIQIILENRRVTTKKEIEEFIHPTLESVTIDSVGIDKKQLTKAIKRINQAIEKKEKICVFGDYDVDGITGTAILWETLYKMGANVIPYIPHRVEEGYGLSSKGISNIQFQISNNNVATTPSQANQPHSSVIPAKAGIYTNKVSGSPNKSGMTDKEDTSAPARNASHAIAGGSVQNDKVKLIITVDNGIVANEAVAFANAKGIDVIVTDHHTVPNVLPEAYAIVHTTKLCGAAVGWVLSQELRIKIHPQGTSFTEAAQDSRNKPTTTSGKNSSSLSEVAQATESKDMNSEHLDLVALATVADLVPLTGANRALLKAALPYLQNTKRVGLKELFLESGIDPKKIGVYEIGHIIGPRLNAMGRMESAMDSLRLLCTKDVTRAKMLAAKLGITNKERQLVTQAAALHAIERFKIQDLRLKNILFIANETYEEGVIGLVAGKLVEEYYRPAIVLSIGKEISKASARSVSGFNIIDFIRSASEHLINAGGHPMAAGFTVKTENIAILQETLEKIAVDLITEDLLTPILKIDLEIPLSLVSVELYRKLQELGPFGMANPEPVFMSKGVTVEDVFTLGRDKKHLKFLLSQKLSTDYSLRSTAVVGSQSTVDKSIEAVAFGIGDRFSEFKKGKTVDIAYVIDENEWNGRKKLQLKIKEIN